MPDTAAQPQARVYEDLALYLDGQFVKGGGRK